MLWIRLDSLSSLLTCRVKQRDKQTKKNNYCEEHEWKEGKQRKEKKFNIWGKGAQPKKRGTVRGVSSKFRLSPDQSKPICEHSYALPTLPPQKIINHSEATSSSRPVCNQPVTKVCVEYPVSHAASRFSFVWQIHTEGEEILAVICSRKCNLAWS